MAKDPEQPEYFTKHLFGAGIECPTKLYYYARDYPENKQAVPFIEHAVYNNRLLKALARSIYPQGVFIDEDRISEAAKETNDLLQQDEIVLFDAIFEHRQMMARLPIVEKDGDHISVYYVRTKAFDSRKHRLTDSNGRIYSKWRSYLLDFAYQLYLVTRSCPGLRISAILVMPEKSGEASTDNLPSLLKPLDKVEKPVTVSASNQELLCKIDVSRLVGKVWHNSSFAEEYLPRQSFEESLFYLRDLYLDGNKVEPEVGLKCQNCEFKIEKKRIEEGTVSGFNECWRPRMQTGNPTGYHVFDLIGAGTTQRIQHRIYDQRNIPLENVFTIPSILEGDGRLTHEMRQSLQIHKAQNKEIPGEIFRPALFHELQRWQYPLHFLDFEAGNYAVPVRKERSPYHLVVFQFSCHTLHEDGSWTHHQWIDDLGGGYPNYKLVRQLREVPGIIEGTIVQYSNFERHALKTIRRELMDEQERVDDAESLIEWIEQIIYRNDSSHPKPPYIADLSRQVKDFYYNSEMENSLSIKDVLQSVMSHSDFLKKKYSRPYSSHNFKSMTWWQPDGKGGARNPYKLLAETGDSPIRRGTEAMVVYGKMIARTLDEEQKQAYQHALLKYCELDTLAMVMIYQHWKQEMIIKE